MRKALMIVLAAGFAAAAFAADPHPFSIHDMLAMDRISDPRVSPDGRLVAFTVSVTNLEKNKRQTDLYLVGTDGNGLRRLTSHEASDTQARWSSDGKSLFFVSTRSGSAQVWKIAIDGGEAQQVTKLPLDVDALEVVPGGKQLLFGLAVFPGKGPAETKRALDEKGEAKSSGMLFDHLFVRHWDAWEDGTRNHVFLYDLASGEAKDLMLDMDTDCPTKPFGGSEDFAVSHDGQHLVFSAKNVAKPSEQAWSTNFDLYLVDLTSAGRPKRVTSNPAWDAQPRFSPDGKTLAYLAMSRAGYEADRFDIVFRDLATDRDRKVTLRVDDSPRGDRSPGELVWSEDAKTLFCTADHLGQHSLFAIDVATGKARIVVEQGTIGSPQLLPGDRILYGMHSLLGPLELYVVGGDGKGGARVTHLNDAKLAAAKLGKPEQFTFTGAKGDTVYGYIVHPVDFDPAKKYPVAFLIHGGPQGSFGNDFHYRWNPQAYAGAGYGVVMIDFHASTGYGQSFTDAVNHDWGGAPYEDLMKGLDFALGKYKFLDGARVGALGASYGGYMINWIAGHTDRFKTLVCHDGNLDEHMAYYDTEELWFPEWENGGPAYKDPGAYSKHSPLSFADKWKTPMLVIHGGKDYRVVDTQGISTFTLLQRKGIPSKFLYFPDENHWVLKPHNSIQWHETVIGWLDQWLK